MAWAIKIQAICITTLKTVHKKVGRDFFGPTDHTTISFLNQKPFKQNKFP